MGLKFFCFLLFTVIVLAKKAKEKPSWAKKNVQDYGDYELGKLYEQWEEDEEPIPNDELPDWDIKKIKPQLNPMDFDNADDIMKASKRGQQALISVSLSGNPTSKKASELTSIWEIGLSNNHIEVTRYQLDDKTVLFQIFNGQQAYEARDYLVDQEGCYTVSLDSTTTYGRSHPEFGQDPKELHVEL